MNIDMWLFINDTLIAVFDNWYISVQHNHWPCCMLQVTSAKNSNGASWTRPWLAPLGNLPSNVLGKVQSHLCLTEWRGNWKCPRGKSNSGEACRAQKLMSCYLCCTLYIQIWMIYKLQSTNGRWFIYIDILFMNILSDWYWYALPRKNTFVSLMKCVREIFLKKVL